MWYVILFIIAIIWIFSKITEGISDASVRKKRQDEFHNERNEKYANRNIDTSKSLFERNSDIISEFAEKISNNSYEHYYIENKTRDCINEICLAEGRMNIRPGSTYLSNWRTSALSEWQDLSQQIERFFREKKNELYELDRRISEEKAKLENMKKKRKDPILIQNIEKRNGSGNICIEQITDILTPNKKTWNEIEKEILKGDIGDYSKFPSFLPNEKTASIKNLNRDIANFNKQQEADIETRNQNKTFFGKILEGYKKNRKEDVLKRIDYVINNINLPKSLPKKWEDDFDPEQQIAIVEIGLPDIVHKQIYKKINLKSGMVEKPLNQKEAKEKVPNIHPAIMLRVAYEIFRNDNVIKLLVLNGWVEYDDPINGTKAKTYTASLAVEKAQISDLNLSKLDPLSAFSALKGKSAGKLIDIIPITPTLSLNRKDKRFVEGKEVLSSLGTETNLASMDWKDFEHLIRELFERVFSKDGVEVKITQASRDRGVDAVVFDPDPIKGGKFIIQAKRYTNTVDVSAVRDLCAVVTKEGASRGIMVTTSSYGSDAYAFAQGAPVTLINGAELLGLLKEHGYSFRINLAEAKKFNDATLNYKGAK